MLDIVLRRPHDKQPPQSLKEGAILPANNQTLIEKIEALPAERIAEVEDFVDFIRLREQERMLTRAAAATLPSSRHPARRASRSGSCQPHASQSSTITSSCGSG